MTTYRKLKVALSTIIFTTLCSITAFADGEDAVNAITNTFANIIAKSGHILLNIIITIFALCLIKTGLTYIGKTLKLYSDHKDTVGGIQFMLVIIGTCFLYIAIAGVGVWLLYMTWFK